MVSSSEMVTAVVNGANVVSPSVVKFSLCNIF